MEARRHQDNAVIDHFPQGGDGNIEGSVAQALKQASREATLLLCAPAMAPAPRNKEPELADRSSLIYGELS
jgi:hypothetical protein